MDNQKPNNVKKHKISFCTVCMNRLENLKQTLPKNIADNISYGNIEFVVLNYNSKDGLDEWIANAMAHYLKIGVLVYIKTDEPQYFLRSHSKNIAAKRASGDIICNVDADNFIGKGFADHINERFTKYKNSYLAVKKSSGRRDCYGRICVLKNDFLAVTGYDESMTDYGFEDFDLTNRLELIGKKAKYISNEKFLKVLNHDDDTRLENESNINEIEKIYIKYINHYSSELFYFFKYGDYLKGIVIMNRMRYSDCIQNIFKKNRKDEYTNSLLNSAWEKGTWHKDEFGIKLKSLKKETQLILTKKGQLRDRKNDGEVYYECEKAVVFQELVMFLSQITNRIKMAHNKKEKRIRVNDVFGETKLVENSL